MNPPKTNDFIVYAIEPNMKLINRKKFYNNAIKFYHNIL
jgi:hypothetical protein